VIFNPLGNVIESNIAWQILSLSDKYSLLLAQPRKAHHSRSIDTVLNFLVEQIHETMYNRDVVAMLLLLNMTGALDKVVPAWLLHNKSERKVLEEIVKWVSKFISNRTITLCLPGYRIDTFPTYMGSLQGSPLLPNLVNACNLPTIPASGTGNVDNVNTLAFGRSTGDNCKSLQTAHQQLL
jgi:hypothetical protein